ncbi:unnamed protein product [Closterium sp. Naga37s-1]|nr:unnamed protein product [Closterium sp. Naga37s-1]
MHSCPCKLSALFKGVPVIEDAFELQGGVVKGGCVSPSPPLPELRTCVSFNPTSHCSLPSFPAPSLSRLPLPPLSPSSAPVTHSHAPPQ